MSGFISSPPIQSQWSEESRENFDPYNIKLLEDLYLYL